MSPQVALALALFAPWLCLLLLALPAPRRAAGWLAPAAAAPALAVALFVPSDAELALGLSLWGGTFAVDAAGRLFLFAAALIWGLCGLFAGSSITGPHERARLFSFWLVSLGAVVALILARDLMSFYAGYAALTIAAYGLIIHDRAPRSLRAGRVYLAFMMIGEVALLAAVALTAAATEAPVAFDVGAAAHPGAATALFLVGFGIKLGVFGAHPWLPRAHPVAPLAASAVLSGVVVKAGALGAWRVLEGHVEASAAAIGVVLLGLCGVAYGAVMGLRSRAMKVVLAWSTVSQMGLVTVLVGAGISREDAIPAAGAALALFSVHHGLSKAALFLGVGLVGQPAGWARTASIVALVAPALALTGAPLTTGWLAKSALETAAAETPYAAWLLPSLYVSSLLTFLLMIWFLSLAWRAPRATAARPWREHAAFGVLIAGIVILPHLELGAISLDVPGVELKPLVHALWPLAAGAVIAATARALRKRRGAPAPAEREAEPVRPRRLLRRARVWTLLQERWLQRWTVVGYLVSAVLFALAWALWP